MPLITEVPTYICIATVWIREKSDTLHLSTNDRTCKKMHVLIVFITYWSNTIRQSNLIVKNLRKHNSYYSYDVIVNFQDFSIVSLIHSKQRLYFFPSISTIGKLYSITGEFGASKYPYKIRRDASSIDVFFPLNILFKKTKSSY